MSGTETAHLILGKRGLVSHGEYRPPAPSNPRAARVNEEPVAATSPRTGVPRRLPPRSSRPQTTPAPTATADSTASRMLSPLDRETLLGIAMIFRRHGISGLADRLERIAS